MLADQWEWHEDDKILNVLPTHHIHGLVNIQNCAIYSGATLEAQEVFNSDRVWDALLRPRDHEDALSLFMAVPTVYYNLIKHFNEKLAASKSATVRERLSKFRLMVAGSASLPGPTLEEWEQISGQRLLERYGMTEIGMAISNPYRGKRVQGHMGYALPGVQCALADLETGKIFWQDGSKEHNQLTSEKQGELYIKSTSMFNRYLNKPEATAKEFTQDGWFKTGDCAIVNEVDDNGVKRGMFKHLGRLS